MKYSSLGPKLCLGMQRPKLRFGRPSAVKHGYNAQQVLHAVHGPLLISPSLPGPCGAELRGRHSQAELGNELIPAVRYLASILILSLPQVAMACATCSGPADAPQSQGMNAAILTLFCVLGAVGLTLFAFVGAVAWRVARHPAGELAPTVLRPQSPAGAIP